jgi:hypothetical protein
VLLGASMSKVQPEKPLLENIDPEKREFISKLIHTSTYVAPLVASFSMASVTVAEAQNVNGSLPK